jgi:F0F1-type ATP synthase assembly protein I
MKRNRAFAILIMVPFTLAVPPIFGWYIGSHLDNWWNTTPYITILGILFGLAAGFREVYRMVKTFGNDLDDDDK